MDYLARREHSLYELSHKLRKKFSDVDTDLLAAVLEALRSEHLQSDERFAESYIRYRKSKGFAYLHIKADLLKRRVSDSHIAQYLFEDDEDWQRSANALVEKRLRQQGVLQYGSKQHRKLSRFLKSRGFGAIEIGKALEKYLC